VAVRIAEEAADLSAPVDRQRQEDGTTRLERLIGSAAVGHTKRQLMADAIRIRRRPESDRGLVPGRPAAGNKEQPASLKIEDTRRAAILAVDGGSQHIPIQLPRTSKIADHQQVGKLNPSVGKSACVIIRLLKLFPASPSWQDQVQVAKLVPEVALA
jgi:hypothetical protein